ncbi:MAG: hypothetical protein R2912_03460 [Eubacteriales bacterium]
MHGKQVKRECRHHDNYRVSDSDYYLADIYLQDITCFVTAFSNDEFMGDSTTVRNIFDTIPNAIIGMNGDYYSNNVHGLVVRNGITYVNRVSGYWDIALLDSAGRVDDISVRQAEESRAQRHRRLPDMGVRPRLLDADGDAKRSFRSKVLPHNPRSVLGYYEPGHYAFLLG